MFRAEAGLILCVLAAAASLSTAQVVGLDFGSQFFKAALVKPGSPFEIVTNVHTKRKTPSMVSLAGGERVFGFDAVSPASRRPTEVMTSFQRLLGKNLSHPDVVDFLTRSPVPLRQDEERGTLVTDLPPAPGSDEPRTFSVEEVVAMMMEHVMEMSSKAAGSPVKDVVIAVPSFATPQERRALLDAAELAGINVLTLVDEQVAASIQYGIDHVPSEGNKTVLIVNVGAHSTQAAVAVFSKRKARHMGAERNVTSFEVLGKGWDRRLGGVQFDDVVVGALANAFNAKRRERGAAADYDVRNHLRPMQKLRRSAQKLREILSANDYMPVSVESVHEDVDLHTNMRRSEFEELAAPLFDRVLSPVRAALQQAGLTPAQIDAVEVIGGGSRIPRVQQLLREELQTDLSVHLNGDEAIALGAAYRAANMSKAFRVRPSFMHDMATFAVGARLTEPGGEGAWSKRVSLYGPRQALNHRKVVTFEREDDLVATLYADNAADVAPHSNSVLGVYNVTGVQGALEGRNVTREEAAPKVRLTFLMDHRGLPRLQRAEAAFQEWAMVSRQVQVNETEAESEGETEGETGAEEKKEEEEEAGGEKAEKEEAEEKEEEGEKEEEDKESTGGKKVDESEDKEKEGTTEEEKKEEDKAKDKAKDKPIKAAPKYVTVQEPRLRTRRIPLKVTPWASAEGMYVLPMGPDAIVRSRERLEALLEADREREARDHAKNDLESYLFAVRSAVFDDEEALEAATTSEQRDALRLLLEEVEDWLYEEGEDAAVTTYTARKGEVTALADPIRLRMAETTARPEAVAAARDLASQHRGLLDTWRSERPWLTEAQLAEAEEKISELLAWLEEQEVAQKQVAAHEPPVFTSADVQGRVKAVRQLMRRLRNIPAPPPPKEEKKEAEGIGEGSGDGSAAGAANSTATDGDTEASGGDTDGAGSGAEEEEEVASTAPGDEAEAEGEGSDDGTGSVPEETAGKEAKDEL